MVQYKTIKQIDDSVRNIFFQGEYFTTQKAVKYSFCCGKEIESLLQSSGLLHFKNFQNKEGGLNIEFVSDKDIHFDGYRLSVLSNKVSIYFSNYRGATYGLRQLYSLLSVSNTVVTLPVICIDDYPSFPLRGVIEGFYGEPYTFQTRLSVLEFLNKYRYNAYFYAPKDEPCHRAEWRKPYVSDKLSEIESLNARSKQLNIDFYFCISPGLDFNFCNECDYSALKAKLRQVLDLGVTHFCLLMDDIKAVLTEEEGQKFSTVAESQSFLANAMEQYLKSIDSESQLIFCPTEYMQNFDTPYRTQLRKYLSKTIAVFWTGYNTVAEKIDEQDAIRVKNSFDRQLVLWDNYPVNDFAPKSRIYLGALCNRASTLSNYHIGYVANLSSKWNTSKFALITSSLYCWNDGKYDCRKSFYKAISELSKNNCNKKSLLDFATVNESCIMKTSEYDCLMKSLYEDNNLAEVYRINSRLLSSIVKLRVMKDKEMLQEISPYIDYFEKEVALLKAVIDKDIIMEEALSLNTSLSRTSNQYLFEYIKREKLINNYEEIKVDSPRENFWKYQQQNGIGN